MAVASGKIRKIYKKNLDNNNYGVGRILLALTQHGIRVSRSSVRRAMKRGGLLHRAPRHLNSLTKADLAAQKAENLIHRDFTADAANRKWLTDITQIQCLDGKLYLAAVLDCYNGESVGLAMDDNMKKELCIRAFRSACQARGGLWDDPAQRPLGFANCVKHLSFKESVDFCLHILYNQNQGRFVRLKIYISRTLLCTRQRITF